MLIDTNIILRYLTGDDDIQSPKSKAMINQNHVTVRIEVIFEVIHVLDKVYEIKRSVIRDILRSFLRKPTIYIDRLDVISIALDCYAEKNIDFVDALLWAYHVTDGEAVFTVDKKLNQLLENHSL